MAAIYWTSINSYLLEDRAYVDPILKQCGLTVVDDAGPLVKDSQYIKVQDKKADPLLDGRTVEIVFERYREGGASSDVKHRIQERRVAR